MAENPETAPSAPSNNADLSKQRLHSLDAYRGLIMLTLAFNGFGLARTAALHLKETPDSTLWTVLQHQFSHAQWVGCAYWDLIQPSFMFMVGLSMAYSYLKRKREGHSYSRMLGHAALRSLILVLLGVFLSSNWKPETNWSFMNVLSQIGLGYTFLFLLWGRTPRTHALTVVGILLGTWLLYVIYPASGIEPGQGLPEAGIQPGWAQEHLAGVGADWHKNANAGHAIDTWLLNLFPRSEAFVFNSGGYQTINFIPSLVTMIIGLMCGELLRSKHSAGRKLVTLVMAGVAGLIIGQLLDITGICPLVKRLWTPSWALFSTGWCCLILAALYAVIDALQFRRWSFPLIVLGMNSIAVYCMGQLLGSWTSRTLQTHFGENIFLLLGPDYEPMVKASLIGLTFWIVCFWMYRQKIFVRI